MLNTISYSTTLSQSIESITINQPGASGSGTTELAHLYEQSVGTELSLSNGNYYPDLPETYVVVT